MSTVSLYISVLYMFKTIMLPNSGEREEYFILPVVIMLHIILTSSSNVFSMPYSHVETTIILCMLYYLFSYKHNLQLVDIILF